MFAYVIRRLADTAVVVSVVGVIVFLILHLSPGDPATIIAGDNASEAQIAAIREGLGLDQSLVVQFLYWAGKVVQGDLGVSIFSNTPVLTLVLQRLEPTVALASTTLVFAVLVAVGFGVIAAWAAGSWLDRGLMGWAVLGFSVPAFVVGYVLIYLFSLRLQWLPVQGYTPIADGIGPWAWHLVLPTVTLGMSYVGLIARITRASMLEVLSEDYIRTARAKGVATVSLLFTHALRNAGVPIVTVIGIGFAMLISGVVITETVFNIAGIGRLVVDAITQRDYPIIQGVILILSAFYVVFNLMIDLVYSLIDPRIRY